MDYIIAIVIGYLLGSVNPAYIFGKLHGFDIREKGTGNAGASNIKVVLGWPYFFAVAGYDISKAIISVLLVRYLFPNQVDLQYLAGAFAVLGHIFPFYLGFKGGKGFASYIGLSLFIDFKTALIVLVCGLLLAFIFRWIVAGTFTVTIAVPIMSYLFHLSIICTVVFLIVSTIMLIKHKENIIRFLKKQEIGINGKPCGFEILK